VISATKVRPDLRVALVTIRNFYRIFLRKIENNWSGRASQAARGKRPMADNTAKLFEPDALMPEQYFAGLNKEAGATNERGLMLAILRDAVECYQKYALARDPQGEDLHRDASDWIFSNDREWPFSFENICDVLGVSAEYVRVGLAPLQRRTPRKIRKSPQIVGLAGRRPASHGEGHNNEDTELDLAI
jgi:hypothetical protein